MVCDCICVNVVRMNFGQLFNKFIPNLFLAFTGLLIKIGLVFHGFVKEVTFVLQFFEVRFINAIDRVPVEPL